MLNNVTGVWLTRWLSGALPAVMRAAANGSRLASFLCHSGAPMARRDGLAIGELTPLTCPLCAGLLTQFNGDLLPLFRCVSGHLYTRVDLAAAERFADTAPL